METAIFINVLKSFLPLAISFFIGISITPLVTHFLYKYKMWKKKGGKVGLDGKATEVFNQLHKDTQTRVPNMGGIIIWASVLITILVIWILSVLFPNNITRKLNFLSQNQTWLPLFALITASLTGLVDDFLTVWGEGGNGLSFKKRALVVLIISFIGAWWFYVKLETSSVFLPFWGDIELGILFIPFFVLVMLSLFSGVVIDGIDGLSGGVMASIFAGFMGIALFNQQIDLAAFSGAIIGGILAFLWFNIPPARFYMSETGILGLVITLAVISFLTDAVLMLPVIAFPLAATSASDIIQHFSKTFRGKKVFRIAPIHHHFEAIGWPPYKVVMRYWVVSIILSVLGVITYILGSMVADTSFIIY